MPKFKVLISEHVSHTFVVDVETAEDAEAMFEDGDAAIDIEPEKSDTTDWFVALVVPDDRQ